MPTKTKGPVALHSVKDFKKKSSLKSKNSHWDLWKDGVTQGSLELFLNCREQFRLAMVEGWTSKKESIPLEFGSAFHHVLAQVHDKKRSVEKAVFHYAQTKPVLTGKDKEEFTFLMAQVAIVADAYLRYWKTYDEGKVWVCREKTFNYPHQCDLLAELVCPQVVPLQGRWDGVFVHNFNNPKTLNTIRIHETKTMGQIDGDGIRLSLPMNLQTMLYAYVAGQMSDSDVDGVLYDVVRRPQLRQGVKEVNSAFLERIQKAIQDRPDFYFLRWEVGLKQRDITTWVKQQLDPILYQLAEWSIDPKRHHFTSPKALFSRYGSRCDLFDLMTRGNSFGLYKRPHPFPELID